MTDIDDGDLVVDAFAGPGGWDEAARGLGVRNVIGIEYDAAACATRAAAGHSTIRADVAAFPLDRMIGRVRGLIASPPCQAYSSAGTRDGLTDVPRIMEHAHACTDRWHDYPRAGWADDRSPLVLEVLRYALTLTPEWIACEQVPEVLPLWETFAHVLRAHGWYTWTGVLLAANYGVPQTRRRAILLASRTHQPAPPPATHDRNPAPSLFGPELLPWVSMRIALGWADGQTVGDRAPAWAYETHRARRRVGFPRVDDIGDSPDGYRERDWRDEDEPAFTVTEKARSWIVGVNTGRDWKPGGTRDDAQIVSPDEPAPTVDGKDRWHAIWGDRPATTVQGDARLWPPGHKVNQADRDRLGEDEANARCGDRAGSDALRLTIVDALLLQSFRADYPLAGNRTKQFEQVGNAIPPLLAAAALAAVIPENERQPA